MAVEAYFFKHDYGSRNDKKMVKLLQKESVAGVGIYWCIVELLYEEGGYLMLEECESIAFALRTKPEIVRRVVINYELFRNDGSRFWSESALRRMEERQTKSKKAKKSAEERWNKGKQHANALQAHSETNANGMLREERRGEEKEKREEREETRLRRETLSLGEFKKFFDEQFLEILQMNHKGKDIDKAIGEAYAHLAADTRRLQVIDDGDAKRLLNTWLSNTRKNDTGTITPTVNGVKSFSGKDYSKPL